MNISLQTVKRAYGTFKAVNDISLDIPSNTIYGIIGKSGAGKSTLMRLVSLLEKPDAGEIYYDDVRVDALEKSELIERRRMLGMIFQNFNLFGSRTAAANIAYPLEIAGIKKIDIHNRVEELLSLVGLEGRGGAAISTLSGGQKQRVAIARALATKPDVLFCDEATSALDPQTTRAILDLIRSLQKEMHLTVVLITHQMEVVRDTCQYVAVLDKGKVVESGSVSQVFAHPASVVTQDFLEHLTSNDGLVRWSKEGGRYSLRFTGTLTGEPVLSRLSRKFAVEFNIRAGGIQHLSDDKNIGTLITDISGEALEVQKAIAYLESLGITVNEEV